MSRLYYCLSTEHDFALVLIAALICTLGMRTTYGFARHISGLTTASDILIWSAAAVFTTASSIWTTHFIAMLAYDPGLPASYDIRLTAASALVALGTVSLAAAMLAWRSDQTGRVIAGATLGLAISLMHATGMAAYSVTGTKTWSSLHLAAAVIAGLALSAAAGGLSASPHRRLRRLTPYLLILAVCGAHFIGMSAVTVTYDPTVTLPQQPMDKGLVALLVLASASTILGLACVALDQKRKRGRKAEERRLRELADLTLEGVLICDRGAIINANASLARMHGQSPEALTGMPVKGLLPGIILEASKIDIEQDAWLVDAKDETIPVRVITREILFDGRAQTVIAVRDQRERLRSDAAMRELATRDTLTGLANRLQYNTVLEERCGECMHGHRPFSILALDLDRFKYVNDTLGHPVGDILLTRVAGRLSAVVRKEDLVARLGGDEFAILLLDTDDPAYSVEIAERIIEVIARPFLINGQIIDIGASVGIALAPRDAKTPEALIRTADLALYRAKEDGRGIYRMFEPEMDARMQARRSLESALRRAISTEEFRLVYQPQVDAKTGVFTGAEALIRWDDAERGIVSPTEFIPLAEEIGLINRIGEWVLRTACFEARDWPDTMTLAVNLSPAQFRDPRLTHTIAGILSETGFPGRRLELEITENLMLQDNQRTLATLHHLRSLGIRFSLDDFGTGYSSLSYLRSFPFDKIKIDRSFIAQTPADPESAAILRAVVALGASLGMTTTAEGVETDAQRAFIAAEGCDQIQGFHISRPIPGDALKTLFTPSLAA